MLSLVVLLLCIFTFYKTQCLRPKLIMNMDKETCRMDTTNYDAVVMFSLAEKYTQSNMIKFYSRLSDEQLNQHEKALSTFFKKFQLGVLPHVSGINSNCLGNNMNESRICDCYTQSHHPLTERKIVWSEKPSFSKRDQTTPRNSTLVYSKHCYTTSDYNLLKPHDKHNHLSVVALFVDQKPPYVDSDEQSGTGIHINLSKIAEVDDNSKITLIVMADQIHMYHYWALLLLMFNIERSAIALFDPVYYIDDIYKLIQVSMCGENTKEKNYFLFQLLNDRIGRPPSKGLTYRDSPSIVVSVYIHLDAFKNLDQSFQALFSYSTQSVSLFHKTLRARYVRSSLAFISNTWEHCELYTDTDAEKKNVQLAFDSTRYDLSKDLVRKFEVCHPNRNETRNFIHVIVIFEIDKISQENYLENDEHKNFIQYCSEKNVSLIRVSNHVKKDFQQLSNILDITEIPVNQSKDEQTSFIKVMEDIYKHIDAQLFKFYMETEFALPSHSVPDINVINLPEQIDLFYIMPKNPKPLLNQHIIRSFVYDKQQDLRKSLSSLSRTMSGTSVHFGWTQYPTYQELIFDASRTCIPVVSLHDVSDESHQTEWAWDKSYKVHRSFVPLFQVQTCLEEHSPIAKQWRKKSKRMLLVLTDDKPAVVIQLERELTVEPNPLIKKNVTINLKPVSLSEYMNECFLLAKYAGVQINIIATPDVYDDWRYALAAWKEVNVFELSHFSTITAVTFDAISRL